MRNTFVFIAASLLVGCSPSQTGERMSRANNIVQACAANSGKAVINVSNWQRTEVSVTCYVDRIPTQQQ